MARFLKDRSKAKGTAPGSLVLIGRQKMEQPVIQLMRYRPNTLLEKEASSLQEAISEIEPETINWINIYGIHELEMIDMLGHRFNLPSLLLEDILNTDQPPKYENGESYDAFILKMLQYDAQAKRIHAEQITILLGENYVLTLQEQRGDVFTPVRERIRKGKGRIRTAGNDYLAYILMDTILDNYLLLAEKIGRQVEDLEDRLFREMDTKIVEEIYRHKTELNYLRKAVRPVRDFLVLLNRTDDSFFQESNRQFLRDLQDLAIQCTDAIELYNNLVSDQLNIYNSNMSNKMNEVMKTLTIFASVFIPLSFVAGIYGMNFKYMPELDFKYGYLIFWIAVLIVGGGLVAYFKRKKWL